MYFFTASLFRLFPFKNKNNKNYLQGKENVEGGRISPNLEYLS